MEEHERVLNWKFWLEGVLIPVVGVPSFLGGDYDDDDDDDDALTTKFCPTCSCIVTLCRFVIVNLGKPGLNLANLQS